MTRSFAPVSETVAKLRVLAASGLSYKEAAKAVNLSVAVVGKHARDYAIPLKRGMQGPRRKTRVASDRSQEMAHLYKAGKTLQQIGDQFGLTRERVRQILRSCHGMDGSDGGASVIAAEKHHKFEARRNLACIKKWGCTWGDYVSLRAMRHPTRAFSSQRKNADSRGIKWELNLWQWWTIWQQSGHWSERGRGCGYQMCRFGDQGPYSVSNVYIASGIANIKDYWADVKSGVRTRSPTPKTSSPERTKAKLREASARYHQTPKFKLRRQLRAQGIPREQRDAIVAQQFGSRAPPNGGQTAGANHPSAISSPGAQ